MMQNNNNSKGFRRFLRDNGYYFVIGLCALAVGVSGYFLLHGSKTQPEEASLSVPVTIETGEASETVPKKDKTPAKEEAADAAEEAHEDVLAETPAEDAETADALAPEETIPVLRTVVRPVSGETLGAYSMTALAYNETTRDWRTHAGIDLAAAAGSPVTAAEAGTVAAVYPDDYLGTTVTIRHSSGYTTVYSNLAEEAAVRVGDTVAAGDVIGYVGNTALLEVGQPSHLHFAVTCGGESIDPEDYFS